MNAEEHQKLKALAKLEDLLEKRIQRAKREGTRGRTVEEIFRVWLLYADALNGLQLPGGWSRSCSART